jgi:hypothetical protein
MLPLVADFRPVAGGALRSSGGNLAVGALVGYAASRTMDRATSWFYGSQTEGSKDREEELAPGGTLVQLGKQLGSAAGQELSDEQAGKVGVAVHRTMGMLYGIATAALVRAGVRPMVAGLAVGTTAWAFIDEGTAIPTFTSYPVESHLRGVVGHGTWGLAAGMLLSLVEARDPR